MLLSHDQLIDLIRRNVIEGGREPAVNSASIDIHLGPKVFVETQSQYIDYRARPKMALQERDITTDGIILYPGMCCLAQSQEVFNLPNYISAEYKLKSSMARYFLDHLNAGWCDAGWNGSVLTLELKNTSQFSAIHLRVGDPIGQMIFFQHAPVPEEKSYAVRGRYNGDKTVTGTKA